MKKSMIVVVAVAGLMVPTAAACGGGADSAHPGATTELTLEVTPDQGAQPTIATLSCDPVGGTHPSAAEACGALSKAGEWWQPVPKNQACTLIYGGPEVAKVTGLWRGERVGATFNKNGGCEIARWTTVAPALDPLVKRGVPTS